MDSLLGTVPFIFALVALGYISGWTGLLKEETGVALSEFAVSIAIPLLLFRTMAQADFSGSLPIALWFCYFLAIAVTWVASQAMVVHVFGRDNRAGVVGGLAAGFSNLVLLGIPFILGLYGQAGFEILSLVISIHLPIMMAASIVLFAILGRDDASARGVAAISRDIALTWFSNPLIIGILSGLLWRFSGLNMPVLIERPVDALADLAGPVALFAIGLGLRRHGITGNVRPAIAVASLKLFLMPAIAFAAVKIIGLPPLSGKVLVLAAALPTGVNPYLIATQFGTGQALASNAMTLGTTFAVLTTAFWLMIAEWAFS